MAARALISAAPTATPTAQVSVERKADAGFLQFSAFAPNASEASAAAVVAAKRFVLAANEGALLKVTRAEDQAFFARRRAELAAELAAKAARLVVEPHGTRSASDALASLQLAELRLSLLGYRETASRTAAEIRAASTDYRLRSAQVLDRPEVAAASGPGLALDAGAGALEGGLIALGALWLAYFAQQRGGAERATYESPACGSPPRVDE